MKQPILTQRLSRDEFEALQQVSDMPKSAKPSACVARNARHLVGIKLLTHHKDGTYELTEKGGVALFVKNCIAGLSALATNADTKLEASVATFLGRKGHIVASTTAGRFEITQKGRECLEDIAQHPN